MAAKKASTKAKAKKTVVKKAAPAKKAAAPKKAAASARSKAKAPARPVAKSAARTGAATPARSAKVTAAARPIARPAFPRAAKPLIPARTVIPNSIAQHNEDLAGGNDADDDQDMMSLNLLSGPRNVQPYIPRRDEQYMSKEQLDHFRQILETWKQDLMQEVDRTMLHMKDEAANFPDPNDRATQESEFSLELRTRDRERKLIRKIEEAIKRIDDGTYGYCNETGEEIGIKRLEARPVATLCVEAQERRERREKQYGDRDDRYR